MSVNSLLAVLLATTTACASTAPRGGTINTAPKTRTPLAVSLSAHIATAPAQLVVRTRVEPDARNRQLLIQWWNEEGIGGSHAVSLEGDRAPIRHDCAIKSVAAGEYTVTAVLTQKDGKQLHRATRLIVIPEGGQFDPEGDPIRLRR